MKQTSKHNQKSEKKPNGPVKKENETKTIEDAPKPREEQAP